MLAEGTVSVFRGGVRLRRLYKGEYFGEQALVNPD
jgi:hypothetical protein